MSRLPAPRRPRRVGHSGPGHSASAGGPTVHTFFFMLTASHRGCDAAGCTAPPAGSYLDPTDSRHIQFLVCTDHLAPLRGGEIPAIITARIDLGMMHERPALNFGCS